MQQLVQIEFNEVTFPFVERYIEEGKLPHFARAFAQFGFGTTTSEQNYDDIEPWINWVSARTGLSLEDHGIFRLGDVHRLIAPQIYEVLESHGLSVGAMSPMNAVNKTHHAAFWIPDPWTDTVVTGSAFVQRLYRTIRRAVNQNAQGKLGATDAIIVALGVLRFVPLTRWPRYLGWALRSIRSKWFAAIFLDAFLSDVFFALQRKTRPNYATLFLNAAAHIQHHYLYSSAAYQGSHKNPSWYVPPGKDPLLDIYTAYDQILADALATGARVIVATALSQTPFPQPIFYYRLKNHIAFLELLNIQCSEVLPRMSRDFLIQFSPSPSDASTVAASSNSECHKTDKLTAAALLRECIDEQGLRVFDVDVREDSIFVTLSYEKEIDRDRVFSIAGKRIPLYEHVAFVALKNGHHSTIGYLFDTGKSKQENVTCFPLKELFGRTMSALGISVNHQNAVVHAKQ
jgi:hypothetical protein